MLNKNYFGGPSDYQGKGKESIDSTDRTTSRTGGNHSSSSSKSGNKTQKVVDKTKKSLSDWFKK